MKVKLPFWFLLHLIFLIRWWLFVTHYLWLAICYLLYESFYMKLAITPKNLFLSFVVVRLVIFIIWSPVCIYSLLWIGHRQSFNKYPKTVNTSVILISQIIFEFPSNDPCPFQELTKEYAYISKHHTNRNLCSATL